ncbi:MAG: radical SAM peptide maturase [Tannerellaceae bacterium]|jgi:uncharacterized protein|nr:radical SAM peptide maturase [Tannerellaceae bacterium]
MELMLSDKSAVLDNYYYKKMEFWRNNGVLDELIPNFTTEINPDKIKYSFANIRQIVIEVTDDCNMNCTYCAYGSYYNNYDNRIGKKQSFKNVRLLFDYLKNIWLSDLNVSHENTVSIGFYGGEPLLNFSLVKKTIDYINSFNIKHIKFVYNMTTNGLLLDKHLDYIVENKFKIMISLDGSRVHNRNRLTKKGKETFDIIERNILLLRNKYPTYFETNVSFNAVLTKYNSEDDIFDFFKSNFGKSVSISQLSVNGIIREKEKDFYENLFQQKKTWFDNSEKNKTKSKVKDLLKNATIMQYASSINNFCGNVFSSYIELFEDQNSKSYIPTGSCFPFDRKIFMSVNGKILPCEKIGQNLSLAKIDDSQFLVDYTSVANIYKERYDKIVKKCNKCVRWKSCGQCVFFLGNDKSGIDCPSFLPWTNAYIYFSELLSFAEKNRNGYEKMIKELIMS